MTEKPYRTKALDDDGARAAVYADGSVEVQPPPSGAPAHWTPVRLSRAEFLALADFARWCWRDIDRGPGKPGGTGEYGEPA